MVVDFVLDRDQADRAFHALSNATRRDIVSRCARAEYSVSDLARAYPMSFAAVQKHVAVLESAGLVTKRRHGREQLVRAEHSTLRRAAELLLGMETVWRDRLDRFEHALVDRPTEGTAP